MEMDYDTDFEDGFGEDDYFTDYNEVNYTLADLWEHCLLPTLKGGLGAAAYLVPTCLLFRFTSSRAFLPRSVIHLCSIVAGLYCLYDFFGPLLMYIVSFAMLAQTVLILTHLTVGRLYGLTTALFCVVFLVICEFFVVHPTSWHQIRGSQMIIAMKAISLAVDVDAKKCNLPSLLESSGYLFHVGTVIFGPWVSYSDYVESLYNSEMDVIWVLSVLRCFILSYMCLTVSTCWATWFFPFDNWKWIKAYRDALSFRFSNYFIGFLSETTAVSSGIMKSSSWDLSVSSPKHVEMPRSLVEVVIYWNRPMHTWLKNYVFRLIIPYGNFAAILLTYAASALLHGLNFQLGAVLLSLGFYTYTEFVLRKKLASVFDACILARTCKPECCHMYKSSNVWVMLVNFGFGLLAMFHLAYLGLMFDSSPNIQEQGYSMSHTLSKWSELNFASHWTALALFLFQIMI